MAHVAPLTFLFSAPLMPRVSVQYDDVGMKPPVSKGTHTHTKTQFKEEIQEPDSNSHNFFLPAIVWRARPHIDRKQ